MEMGILWFVQLYFLDFAVGAPYDGPNGRGAVYIYQGTKDGIKREYTQVNFYLVLWICNGWFVPNFISFKLLSTVQTIW